MSRGQRGTAVKFCQNRSIHCWGITIFRFFKDGRWHNLVFL